MQTKNELWQVIKGYFNALPDKEDEKETISAIRNDAFFHGAKLWVLVFAIFIASLGLNVNSTAVIIGAMLISPLMGPIIGMGLAIGISDLDLLRRSFKNYLIATLISVLTATVYFLLTPLTDAQSELLARTSPTLYDVFIALIGGAAGFLALATKGKGNVIPGVAIATALMPPLCTAGYGLAMGKSTYFFGAFYLFFINTVFICLATFIGTRLLKFKQKQFLQTEQLQKVKRYIIAIVVITMLPATYITIQIITKSVQENNIRKFIKQEMSFNGTQILSHNTDKKNLNVVALGRIIPPTTIKKLKEELKNYQLEDYSLNVIQGAQSDSAYINNMLYKKSNNNDLLNKELMEQSEQLQALEAQLNKYTRYKKLKRNIEKEIVTLWPSVNNISLSVVDDASTDTTKNKDYVVAIIGCKNGLLENNSRTKMHKWLKERIKADSIRLIVTR